MPPKKLRGPKSVVKTTRTKKVRKNLNVERAIRTMDHGALAFRNLLLDPCNAPLSGPVYDGIHSGIYRRYRRIYNIPATEVENVFIFQPGTNSIWQGGHSSGTAGTAITFTGQAAFTGGNLGTATEMRCISACVKIRYTGSESARAGVIGLATGGYFFSPASTGVTVSGAQSQCVILNRVGETTHEVKFCPLDGDQNMSVISVTGVSTLASPVKSTMMITLKGVPAGSIQIELTSVVELDSTDTGTDTTGTANAVEPSSSNTLNQVLRSLGPVTNWAFHQVVVPTIRGVTSSITRTVANSSAMAMTGMRLLTL